MFTVTLFVTSFVLLFAALVLLLAIDKELRAGSTPMAIKPSSQKTSAPASGALACCQ